LPNGFQPSFKAVTKKALRDEVVHGFPVYFRIQVRFAQQDRHLLALWDEVLATDNLIVERFDAEDRYGRRETESLPKNSFNVRELHWFRVNFPSRAA
jgi:hypothetical protein